MKAEELRCGNLVLDWNNRICIVEQINSRMDTCKISTIVDGYKYESCQVLQINPIQLTEEWFLKFGFGLHPWGWVNKESDKSLRITIQNNFEREGNSSLKIEFVHQLQNLYFALTGEELILSELGN